MAAADFITTVYTKIWTLLEAHNGFANLVKAGNRIKLSANTPYPFKDKKAEADFPEAVLLLGEFSDSGFTLTDNFSYTPSFNVTTKPWKERVTQVYVLTLTHRDLRIGSSDLLELEALTALRKGGPRWGLSYVKQWGPVTGTRMTGFTSEAGGTERLQTTLRIPVVMDFDGASMIT